jgi:lipoate synthase
VKQTMADLRAVNVDILTLGQYLQVWSYTSLIFLSFLCSPQFSSRSCYNTVHWKLLDFKAHRKTLDS